MTVHEFGKGNKELLILFHPLGARWDIFNYVTPILEKDFHLVIPAMPGFDPDAPKTDFTGVERIADETAAWLIKHGHESITCLYGCSMGGAVAARMLEAGKIRIHCAVLDGGRTPYRFSKPPTHPTRSP